MKELDAVFVFYDEREYQEAYEQLRKWVAMVRASGSRPVYIDYEYLEPICEICFRVRDYESVVDFCTKIMASPSENGEHGFDDLNITDTIKFKAFRAEAQSLMAQAQAHEAPLIQSDAIKLHSVLQQRGAEK